jgi:hypothetical protein
MWALKRGSSPLTGMPMPSSFTKNPLDVPICRYAPTSHSSGRKIPSHFGSDAMPRKPVCVLGNAGVSVDPKAKIVDVQGCTGTIEDNVLKSE